MKTWPALCLRALGTVAAARRLHWAFGGTHLSFLSKPVTQLLSRGLLSFPSAPCWDPCPPHTPSNCQCHPHVQGPHTPLQGTFSGCFQVFAGLPPKSWSTLFTFQKSHTVLPSGPELRSVLTVSSYPLGTGLQAPHKLVSQPFLLIPTGPSSATCSQKTQLRKPLDHLLTSFMPHPPSPHLRRAIHQQGPSRM